MAVLQAGDFQLAQSVAMLQYIADKAGEGEVSAEQRAATLSYALFVADIQKAMYASQGVKDEQEREEKIAKDLVPRLERLDAHAARAASGWLVGDSITFADTAVFEVVSQLQRELPQLKANVDKLPSLQALLERVRQHERVAEFLAKPEVAKRW